MTVLLLTKKLLSSRAKIILDNDTMNKYKIYCISFFPQPSRSKDEKTK